MPLYRRLPKRGFNPIGKTQIAILNLEKIQSLNLVLNFFLNGWEAFLFIGIIHQH